MATEPGPGRPWQTQRVAVEHLSMASNTKLSLRDVVRVFNKHVLNPVMLRAAGRKHFYASVIQHTGRITAKRYATPVVANRVADGYLIPLPYGTEADWVRNVVAAKRAAITSSGETHEVTDPQVLDTHVAFGEIPTRRRRAYERLGIEKLLKVTFVQ